MSKEKTIQMNVTTFTLSNGTSFEIIHDLPVKGNINSITAAFDNWIVRTKEYTGASFAQYVRSKNLNVFCMTKKAYDKIYKDIR